MALWRVADGRKLTTLRAGGPVADAGVRSGRGDARDRFGRVGEALVGRRRPAAPHAAARQPGARPSRSRPTAACSRRPSCAGRPRLWDVESGRALRVLHGHRPRSRVTDVVFCPTARCCSPRARTTTAVSGTCRRARSARSCAASSAGSPRAPSAPTAAGSRRPARSAPRSGRPTQGTPLVLSARAHRPADGRRRSRPTGGRSWRRATTAACAPTTAPSAPTSPGLERLAEQRLSAVGPRRRLERAAAPAARDHDHDQRGDHEAVEHERQVAVPRT